MRLFTAAFFAGLALIAGLNLAARMVCLSRLPDPALLGRWGEGQAFNVPGYDTGEDKALLVAMMPTAPAVAIGSSHFGELSSGPWPGLYNLSTGDSSLQYLAGAWQGLVEAGKQPPLVLLSADPFFLNDYQYRRATTGRGNSRFARFALRSGLPAWLKAGLVAGDLLDRFHLFCLETFSLDSLHRSVWTLRHRAEFGLTTEAAVLADYRRIGLARDGHDVVAGMDRPQADLAAFQAATAAAVRRPGTYDRWRLSWWRRALFEALLEDMRSRGTRVWLAATPVDDVQLDWQRTRQAGVFDDYAAYARTLLDRGLVQRLWLDQNRASCGCDEGEFKDGHHPNLACSDKFLRRLLAPRP